jgi:imidazoleglycerol phosphate dehydratase HisB
MSEQRTMTIKRGMSRLKTIQGQLNHITDNIRQHAVVSDKQKHVLGDTSLTTSPEDIKKNHEQARKQVESYYQQFHDLITEYIKIKVAIDKANSETFITVAGKRMSLREALLYKQRDGIKQYMTNMVQAYNQSVANAMRVVQHYNGQLTSIPDPNVRQASMADIESLVKRERIVELDEFINKFTSEVDGELDDAIISTPIYLD